MSPTTVEKQITNYLSKLTATEKEAVLTVVKTIAEAHDNNDMWDENFLKEMDSRTASYENGTAQLYKFEDMEKATIDSYHAKKGSN